MYNPNTNEIKPLVKKILQAAPWVIIIVLSIAFLALGEDITAQDLMKLTPKNDTLAVIFIIGLFAVKSFLVVLPIPVLYIVSALIFDPAKAIMLNIAGMTVSVAISYWVGRYSGVGLVNRLMKKHPKIKLLETLKNDNEIFFSFIVRAVGFLPCELVSMILGALKINFLKYLIGTIPGMLPGLIATSLIGSTITNPKSPAFIISVIVTVLIAVFSTVIYKRYTKTKQ